MVIFTVATGKTIKPMAKELTYMLMEQRTAFFYTIIISNRKDILENGLTTSNTVTELKNGQMVQSTRARIMKAPNMTKGCYCFQTDLHIQ